MEVQCGVCEAPASGQPLPAEHMRSAVTNGFDPFALGLSSATLALAADDPSANFVRKVVNEDGDWPLCANCRARVAPYLNPAEGGTGEQVKTVIKKAAIESGPTGDMLRKYAIPAGGAAVVLVILIVISAAFTGSEDTPDSARQPDTASIVLTAIEPETDAPASVSDALSERTLLFTTDVGQLLTRPANADRPEQWRVGPRAQGAVSIEQGQEAKLVLGSDESDLAFIENLPDSGLQALSLGDATLEDEALSAIAGLDGLQYLSLEDRTVTPAVVEAIASIDSLVELDLRDATLNDTAIRALAAMTNLQTLNLRGTNVADDQVANLQIALPDCAILH